MTAVTNFITGSLWPFIQVLIGLNVVIFFHELGHFLAARWAGVKVERFALGMGKRLVGFKRGDTDFCLCALPIGGYVKMLGQEDFAPVDGKDTVQKGSYQSAPVGKRLVIISAGVIMNVILAMILFVIVSLVGLPVLAPVVGDVAPHSPAAQAEITWETEAPPTHADAFQPGDRIIAAEGGGVLNRMLGSQIQRFSDLSLRASLADLNDTFLFTFQREVGGKIYTGQAKLGVRYDAFAGMPLFGISQASSNKLMRNPEWKSDSPFETGDVLIRLNGEPIAHGWDIDAVCKTIKPGPLKAAVLRKGKEKTFTVQPILKSDLPIYRTDGERVPGRLVALEPEDDTDVTLPNGDEITVKTDQALFILENGEGLTIPAADLANPNTSSLDVLGMSPRSRPKAVQLGSPADKAGLLPGDVILSYGGKPTPTFGELQEIAQKNGDAPLHITVLRDGKSLDITVTPEKTKNGFQIGIMNGVDQDSLNIAHVRPNSPAAKAGVQRGALITAVNDQPVKTWSDLVLAIEKVQVAKQPLSLTIQYANETSAVSLGNITKEQFDPEDYHWYPFQTIAFEALRGFIQYNNPLKAIAWGGRETCRLVLSSYGSLISMARRTVSTKHVSGPLGIFQIATGVARESFIRLVYFIAIISSALAVFNFLPLPVLDGGHAVLLLIEKVRGKPLPLKVVNTIQMVGLLLILCIFVLVLYQDIMRFDWSWLTKWFS